MNGRSRDVEGVHESPARERPVVHKTRSQAPDCSGDHQDRHVGECRQATPGSQRISAARFSEDRLGNVEVVSFLRCPPGSAVASQVTRSAFREPLVRRVRPMVDTPMRSP